MFLGMSQKPLAFAAIPANHRVYLFKEMIHSNCALENESVFAVNGLNHEGFTWGFPDVLIRKTAALILGQKPPSVQEKIFFLNAIIFFYLCTTRVLDCL